MPHWSLKLAREWVSAEDLTSYNATTGTERLNNTGWTGTAAEFVTFMTCFLHHDSGTHSEANLDYANGSGKFNQCEMYDAVTSEDKFIGAPCGYVTSGGSTFDPMEQWQNGSGSFDCDIRGSHMVTVAHGANDEVHAGTEQSTTSTSYTTPTGYGKTFTVSSGTVYVVVRATLMQDTSGKRSSIVLEHSSTTYGEMTMTPQSSTSEERGWMWCQQFTGLTGSNTFNVQIKTQSGGTARVKDMEMWIFHADDDFEDAQFNEYTTTKTETSTTFTDDHASGILTFTPSAAGDYLVIGTAIVQGGNHTTNRGEHKFVADGTDKGTDAIKSGTANPANNQYCYPYIEVLNLDADSTTFKWQQRRTAAVAGAASALIRRTISAVRFASGEKDVFLGRLAGMAETVLATTSQ